MKAFTWLVVLAVVFFGLVVTAGALSAPDEVRDPSPVGAANVSGFPHEALQPDAAMTQQMSAPDVLQPMHRDHPNRMLDRSQSSTYLRALEQHQRDIDRMLARPTP